MVMAVTAEGEAGVDNHNRDIDDECESCVHHNDDHVNDDRLNNFSADKATNLRSRKEVPRNMGNDKNKKKEEVSLRRLSQIPVHLQFNKYVISHYRPPLSFKGCLKSLTYFHNETINILTHGLPLLGVLAWIPWMLPWNQIKTPWLPSIHILACLSPWVGSTLYHLFMCHTGGKATYLLLLKLDLLGIWVTQSFGSLVTICASIHCLENLIKYKILLVYVFVSILCLYKAMKTETVWGRRFAFFWLFSVRVGCFTLRCSSVGGGHPGATYDVVMQDMLACVGVYIGAVNIPEKWFPGRLDLIFNSHHIMHIMVLYAVYHMHRAATLDLVWMSEQDPCNSMLLLNTTETD